MRYEANKMTEMHVDRNVDRRAGLQSDAGHCAVDRIVDRRAGLRSDRNPGNWKKHFAMLLAVIVAVFCLSFASPFALTVKAADATDEIEHFLITVDVQEDASLLMTYHIDWKVLDDVEYGPLEWVNIGLPNSHHSDVTALSDSISRIEDNSSSLNIYLDREYYEDEVASFEFSFVQDHMYQIDRYVDGETVFIYTPAWFDGIEVDDLTIRWNADKAGAWQPECVQEDGYLVFTASLAAGDRYSMTVAYPNDAFAFSVDRQASDDSSYSGGDNDYDYDYDGTDDLIAIIGGLIVLILFFVLPIVFIVKFIRWIAGGAGFGNDSASADTEKKIVRTKIVYYETCPGCGAGRVEGKDECPYCGRSMIKSKEVVEEKDLVKPEEYRKTGTYRYGNDPNTFILVNVINTPVSRPRHSGGSAPLRRRIFQEFQAPFLLCILMRFFLRIQLCMRLQLRVRVRMRVLRPRGLLGQGFL